MKKPPTDDTNQQDLAELRKRYDHLHAERIRAEADLRNATEALDKERKAARDEFGTDDLDELRRQLMQMEADNQKKLADYRAHLDQIEASLRQVEAQRAGGDNPDSDTATQA